MRGQVLERLAVLGLPRITLDFDGSVCSTKRHAEGTAVGFNRKKKGLRSYYPLFCTKENCSSTFSSRVIGSSHYGTQPVALPKLPREVASNEGPTKE
jgi:hypothetical protein